MNNLGYKIKFLRKKLNLTQQDLSCEILNRTSLSKIEADLLTPSLPQLAHIAKVFNVSMSYLLDFHISDPVDFTRNSQYIEEFFNNEEYFKIIEEICPYNFSTNYYVGMSYYKLDLYSDAEKYLNQCEKHFKDLLENEKLVNIEKLCISINTLRKMKIKSFKDIDNLIFLKKALNYLNIYNHRKCEIYFAINNNIGVYYLYNENYEKTISFLENFLKINFNITSSRLLCSIHLNLNIAYFAVKNYDKAIDYIKKAIFFYDFIGDRFQAGECYINLFNCYMYSNNINECIELFNLISNDFFDEKLIERFKVLELNFFYNINDIDSILQRRKEINYTKLIDSPKMDYDFIMGRVNFMIKNFKASRSHYKKCLDYLIENKKYLDLTLLYEDMFNMSNIEEYKLNSIKYKNLCENEKYNHLCSNITCPHYFLYS